MRWLALLVLLLAPAWTGCLGGPEEEQRLAQPTSSPIVVPRSPPPRQPTVTYNFTDPGYRMTAPWRAGDGWDYESNQSHVRHMRVLDSRLVNGSTWYIVEERSGKTGMPTERTVISWVNGRDYSQVNATDDTGGKDSYQPGIQLRFFKNGSYGYNHTRVEGSGRKSVDEQVGVQSRLHGQHSSLLFPWGYVEAKRVEQTTIARAGAGANRTESVTTHWVHKDYLHDVQYQLPSGETFKLTAVKAGDFRRGTLSG